MTSVVDWKNYASGWKLWF